jgi:arylsulfatase A-like enzyme
MMRSALTVVGLVCSALWWAFTPPAATPPHVLLILTDDQGYGDVGLHGNALIETPAIDQLAKESAQFERFFVSPLCAPTRASLLTGRYHLRTGTVSVSKGMEVMKSQETTLAELFKANGYQTGIFGKWHNGAHGTNHPNEQGFDEFFGFCGGHWSNYFDTHLTAKA